jgi:hypothetical protein
MTKPKAALDSQVATAKVYPPLTEFVFRQGFAAKPKTTIGGEIARKSTEFQLRNKASLKIRALSAFESYGALNPPAWSVIAGMTPVRSSYSYLLRLHRWGLLTRGRDGRGLLLYALTEKGSARLAWLRRQSVPIQKPA